MSENVVVNFPIDRKLKENVENICERMGLSLQTALTIFCKKLEQERRIPFEISADPDPFFQPANLRYLENKLNDYDAGRLHLAEHDLIETR